MHSKSNNVEVMTCDNPDKVVEELFDLLFSRYQVALERQMWGWHFIYDYINLLYYKCYKINFKRSGSYIYTPD